MMRCVIVRYDGRKLTHPKADALADLETARSRQSFALCSGIRAADDDIPLFAARCKLRPNYT